MLRAQALENIFTLLPILLIAVVSIVLRTRAARRRKQRGEAAGPSEAAGRPAEADRRVDGSQAVEADRRADGSQPLAGARQGTPHPFVRQRGAKPPGPAETFSPQKPPVAPTADRESYAYPPPLPLNDLKSQSGPDGGPPLPQSRRPPGRTLRRPAVHGDLRERMQARAETDRAAYSEAGSGESVSGQRASIAARLERLPPLKRAIVWAEILGPPGGLQ